MFRYALAKYVIVLCCLCIGFRADAQAVWDSLLNETIRLKDAWDMPGMLRVSRYSDSLLSLESNPDSFYLCAYRHQTGDALYNLGRYTEAIAVLNRAIDASKDDPQGLNHRGKILFDRAFSEYALQYFKQAYQSVLESETILSALESPDYDYLLSVYADICFQAVDLGYLEDAEKYLLKGEKLLHKHLDEVVYVSDDQSTKEVLFEYNFVLLYSDMGEEEKLLEHINNIKAIKEQKNLNEGDQYMFAVGLNHVADFYLNFHDRWSDDYPFIQAKRYLDEAFEALDQEAYPGNFAQFTFNRNKAYRKSGNFDLALKGNDYLLSIADSNDYRMPFFVVQRGLIYAAAGKKQEAIDAFVRMAELIHTSKEPLQKDYRNFQPSMTVNHTDLFAGVMDEVRKMYPEDSEVESLAADLYPLALEQFVYSYQHNTFNPKLREFYEKTLLGILETREVDKKNEQLALTELLSQIEHIENRLAWQEHLLHRRFNELKIPDSLLFKELNLRSDIAAAKRDQKSEMEIFELEDQLGKFQRGLQEQYPAHADFVSNSFELPQLQALLGPQTLILRYKKVGESFFLFVVSGSDVQLFHLGEKEKIATEVAALLENTLARKGGGINLDSLCQRLLPIDITDFRQLIIIPDGALHDVPFEMLSCKGAFLVESHTISYATHLVFVNQQLLNPAEPHRNSQLMAFAPTYGEGAPELAMRDVAHQLKGAQAEVDMISKAFDAHIFTDKQASKKYFFKEASQANILHLAMHADINNVQPELSYLLFSTDTEDDKMYVEELYGMNLQADLAVLSACNTGKGKMDDRKGMVSLHRAFTYAGVPATVASLWSVPDQASKEIMKHFYDYLSKGKNKGEALRLAKLSYLEETDDPHFRHPFFWAGFVLYGDNGALQMSPKQNKPAVIWIAGLLIVVMFAGLFFRMKNRQAV
jgi:tetratricopeptide (TPR) repeat protein